MPPTIHQPRADAADYLGVGSAATRAAMLPGHALPEDLAQAEPVPSIIAYLVDEWFKKNAEATSVPSLTEFAEFADALLSRNRPVRLEHSADSNYILQLQDNRRVAIWPLEKVVAGAVDSSGSVQISGV